LQTGDARGHGIIDDRIEQLAISSNRLKCIFELGDIFAIDISIFITSCLRFSESLNLIFLGIAHLTVGSFLLVEIFDKYLGPGKIEETASSCNLIFL